MSQEADTTARTISFNFSDVPLIVGFTQERDVKDRKPLAIALISGTCEVSTSGTGKDACWDMEEIKLDAPILHWPDVPIKWVRECQTGRELWEWVSKSIVRACTEEINTLIDESAVEIEKV